MTSFPSSPNPNPQLPASSPLQGAGDVDAKVRAFRADRYRDLMEMLHGPPMTVGERLGAARRLGKDIGEG